MYASLDCRSDLPPIVKKVKGFTLKTRVDPSDEGFPCHLTIRSPNGKKIFQVSDWGMAFPVLGMDVNGDGVPDVVVETYSGGAHCCWTYYVVSLGKYPGLVLKFENDRSAGFVQDKKTRKMEIRLWMEHLITSISYHTLKPRFQVYICVSKERN
jgi:hypothetical protein